MDVLGLNINSTLDWSALITAVAIVSYFFGHIISSSKFQRNERAATYVEGVFFLSIYVVLPLIVIFTVSNFKDHNLSWWLLILIPQAIVLKLLHTKHIAITTSKINIDKLVKATIRSKSKSVAKKLKLTSSRIGAGAECGIDILYSGLTTWSALFTSFFYVFAAYILINSDVSLIYIYFSVLMSIAGLSLVAVLVDQKQLPEAEIVLQNKTIRGRLNKIEEGYVTLLANDRIMNINKDQIVMIRRISYDRIELKSKLRKLAK